MDILEPAAFAVLCRVLAFLSLNPKPFLLASDGRALGG